MIVPKSPKKNPDITLPTKPHNLKLLSSKKTETARNAKRYISFCLSIFLLSSALELIFLVELLPLVPVEVFLPLLAAIFHLIIIPPLKLIRYTEGYFYCFSL